MDQVVVINPKIMHGEPCFAGTRVTVQSLIDHLEAGYTIDGYLSEFPTVHRVQVVAFLDQMTQQARESATTVSA